MADETFNPRSQDRQPGASRGGRGGGRDQGGREQGGRDQGGREPGGFRIRLSENEMRAARAVQEAFGLRSTVAALGMALRTTAQLLEQGQLDEQIAQHKAQAQSRGEGPRGDGRRDGGPRQGGRGDGRAERAPRVDPFARPSRPEPAVAEPAQPETTDEAVSAELDETAAADAIDASPDSDATPDSDTSPATDTAETTTEA